MLDWVGSLLITRRSYGLPADGCVLFCGAWVLLAVEVLFCPAGTPLMAAVPGAGARAPLCWLIAFAEFALIVLAVTTPMAVIGAPAAAAAIAALPFAVSTKGLLTRPKFSRFVSTSSIDNALVWWRTF